MQRKNINDDFEQFIRQNADQFRIFPTPDAWKGIEKSLQKRKRRFFAFAFSTLIALTATGYFLWNGNDERLTAAPFQPLYIYKPADNQVAVHNSNHQPNSQASPAANLPVTTGNNYALTDQIVTNTATTNGFEKVENNKPDKETFVAENLLLQTYLSPGLLYDYPNRNRSALNIATEDTEKDKPFKKPSSRIRLKRANFEFQYFITPAISYRKLTENKSYLRNALRFSQNFNVISLYDVNNMVTHKPDLGLEFGVLAKYKISQKLKVRAGLQFNINRYSIKAFSYVPEVATIALNNGFWVDSVNTIARYRNFNGGVSNWLENLYFQFSAPVGVEYKIKGNKHSSFGIATSIQPTYLVGDRAYLITTDYKNYAQVPSLVRRWNVNTNLETFVTFSNGRSTWQVGPQVRYQLLSSFVTQYPVKENLFDFGVKVGVTLDGKNKPDKK